MLCRELQNVQTLHTNTHTFALQKIILVFKGVNKRHCL